MERSFAQRMVPNKVFESYTPVELALRRATLENPAWVQAMDQMVRGVTVTGPPTQLQFGRVAGPDTGAMAHEIEIK
jgi:hypothetical protein